MKIEAIILYILQVLFLLLESYVAYLVLQYLKRKSLGMQTILDKVVKDTILSVLFDQILRVLVMGLIVEFTIPLSENTAFIIMTLIHFFSVLRVWYIFSVIVVRYILVFYHTYLNIFDEKVTGSTPCQLVVTYLIGVPVDCWVMMRKRSLTQL